MHAADELAELDERGLCLLMRFVDESSGAIRVGLELLPCETEIHRERDEPRLGAVVQVALDPLELVLLRDHGPCSRSLELVDAFVESRRQQQTRKHGLAMGERGGDPRGDDRQDEPHARDRERPGPAVHSPAVRGAVAELEDRAARRDPPPQRHRERRERKRPQDDRRKTESEPDDREEDQPEVVLPGLRIGADDPHPPPEAAP